MTAKVPMQAQVEELQRLLEETMKAVDAQRHAIETMQQQVLRIEVAIGKVLP